MNMLSKGFGCFVSIMSMSFSLIAEGNTGSKVTQDTDTAISTTEIVIAAAERSPVELNNPSSQAFVSENTLSTSKSASKGWINTENKYSTLHPLAIAFVRKYEERNEKRLENIISRYSRQMALIDKIMTSHELPMELKYLALIESEMFSGAVSKKGAVGPWQFMATTGRLMGLTITRHRDDRRDLSKSTHAAAKYLKILHNQFDDWLLVIAAYNGGASRVESAIRRSQSRDFWKLQYYLPAESRAHVKKYIAARYILEKNLEVEVPMINMDRLIMENLNDLSAMSIQGKYNSRVITQFLNMDMTTFDLYNPDFEKEVIAGGYNLRLPKDKMKLFKEKRIDILNESIELLLKSNNVVLSGNKDNYPQAIALPKTKGIISTAGQQKTTRK